MLKLFGVLSSNVLHNYFGGFPTKLFSDLYLVNFLDTSTKLFFFRKKIFIRLIKLIIKDNK